MRTIAEGVQLQKTKVGEEHLGKLPNACVKKSLVLSEKEVNTKERLTTGRGNPIDGDPLPREQ